MKKKQDEKEITETKGTELKTIIDRIEAKINISTNAQETAKDIQNEIAPDKELPPEQMWMPLCPMPTDMCRVSPFFPMQTQKLKERKFIQDMIITSSS